MKCPYCGSELAENAKFCGNCGAPAPKEAPEFSQPAPQYQSYQQNNYQTYQQSNYQTYQQPAYDVPVKQIGLWEAVGLYFTHYADFSGRSTRAEYWWIVLFNMIINAVAAFLPDGLSWIMGLYSLATLVPGIAVAVRRLHDIGKSGWYYLFGLIPLVGWIFLIVWFCRESEGDNQYGPRKTQNVVDSF